MNRLVPGMFAFAAMLQIGSTAANDAKRPRIVGLTHIAVRVHDLNASRHFYGDLLGFQEAFSVDKNRALVMKTGLPPDQVRAVFFKVNDRAVHRADTGIEAGGSTVRRLRSRDG